MIFLTKTKLTKRMYCSINSGPWTRQELDKGMYGRAASYKKQFLAIYFDRCNFTYPVK